MSERIPNQVSLPSEEPQIWRRRPGSDSSLNTTGALARRLWKGGETKSWELHAFPSPCTGTEIQKQRPSIHPSGRKETIHSYQLPN